MTSSEPSPESANEPSSSRAGISSTQKKAKNGLSCQECRRSKLKCDRQIPCGSCVKRGCASICPDGSLVATKGNKVLQSQNHTLQEAVKRMTARIRDLETALSTTQSQLTAQPHPLLQETPLNRENEAILQLLEGGAITGAKPEELRDAFGSLSIGEQGQIKYYGQTASTGFLQQLLPTGGDDDPYRELGFQDASCEKFNYGLPNHILELSSAFPFGKPVASLHARRDILQFIPPREKVLQHAKIYFENIATMFRPFTNDDFTTNIMDKIYNPPSGMVFEDDAYARGLAERYCALGRAALSLDSLAKDATTYTVLSFFVLSQYYELANRATVECQWQIGGLMSRLTYQIGLQRDPSVWSLDAAETQRRRILFWEIYTWDSWSSIIYGRPPSMDIRYTDCRFPEDLDGVIGQNGELEFGFHAWKYRFAAGGLSQIINHIFSMKSHDYNSLIELDRNLRKIQVPLSLQSPTSLDGESMNGKAWSSNPRTALTQYSAVCMKESVLLYIHRRFFARALRVNPKNPLESKYGASVMAAYRSCCLLIQGLESLRVKHTQTAQRISFFFSNAFSSCIVLGCLIYNTPSCPLAKSAMDTVDIGVDIYTKYASKSTHCPLSSELVLRMREKNHQVYDQYIAFTKGLESEYRPDHSHPQCNFMRVLEGTTTVINFSNNIVQHPQDTSPAQSNHSGSREHSPSSMSHDGSSNGSSNGQNHQSHMNMNGSNGTTNGHHHPSPNAPLHHLNNGSPLAVPMNGVSPSVDLNDFSGMDHDLMPNQGAAFPPMPSMAYTQHPVGPITDLSEAYAFGANSVGLSFAENGFAQQPTTGFANVHTSGDLTLGLPSENDEVGWDRIFAEFGGRTPMTH